MLSYFKHFTWIYLLASNVIYWSAYCFLVTATYSVLSCAPIFREFLVHISSVETKNASHLSRHISLATAGCWQASPLNYPPTTAAVRSNKGVKKKKKPPWIKNDFANFEHKNWKNCWNPQRKCELAIRSGHISFGPLKLFSTWGPCCFDESGEPLLLLQPLVLGSTCHQGITHTAAVAVPPPDLISLI